MSMSEPAGLIVREQDPFNGGPRLNDLINNHITPNSLFFVRSHGRTPDVSGDSYRLIVDGLVERPLSLSLAEILERFPVRQVAATLECAGNRRTELSAAEPIPNELPWGAEAISHAVWSGVSLRDVLQAAGLRGGEHVALLGFDQTERRGQRIHFGGSIPLDKALQPEVLLATEMNGQPLPAAHGAPLRLIVPGYFGARSVKWLGHATVQSAPSDNYFQSVAYRLFRPGERADNVDVPGGLMLSEAPVTAVMAVPAQGQRVAAGSLTARGYAYVGGGRRVVRVEVSVDGGRSWTSAKLDAGDSAWSWQLWQAQMTVSAGAVEVLVRAVDTSANSTPEDVRSVWNFKGYANNAWHRVQIHAD